MEVAHGGKERGARGEDQSTGDDFITTRHSSTTLKYQKSGGLIQVRQSSARGSARRGVWKFSAQCFSCQAKEKGKTYTAIAERSRIERRKKLLHESNPRRSDSRDHLSPFSTSSPFAPKGRILLAQAAAYCRNKFDRNVR